MSDFWNKGCLKAGLQEVEKNCPAEFELSRSFSREEKIALFFCAKSILLDQGNGVNAPADAVRIAIIEIHGLRPEQAAFRTGAVH